MKGGDPDPVVQPVIATTFPSMLGRVCMKPSKCTDFTWGVPTFVDQVPFGPSRARATPNPKPNPKPDPPTPANHTFAGAEYNPPMLLEACFVLFSGQVIRAPFFLRPAISRNLPHDHGLFSHLHPPQHAAPVRGDEHLDPKRAATLAATSHQRGGDTSRCGMDRCQTKGLRLPSFEPGQTRLGAGHLVQKRNRGGGSRKGEVAPIGAKGGQLYSDRGGQSFSQLHRGSRSLLPFSRGNK